MSYVAQMRIGSIEITAALAAIALVASRPRIGRASDAAVLAPRKVVMRILELGRERGFEGLCPMTIGRERSCELVLADSEVSRRHARLETQDGRVFLRDLESRNGTYLNGRQIDAAIEVRAGDHIDVGATRLTIERFEAWT
jgi:pSer/pThr/pTyr-binding forkhead associated (FHA) protein